MAICSLMLTLFMAIHPGQEAANLRVRIIVYEVPFMIVSRTIAGVAEDGSVVGTMVGGSTTGSFPDKAVTLQNRLPAGSYSVDIKDVIREFLAYSCIRAQDITVYELAEHELVFNDPHEAKREVYQELDEMRPSPVSYRLNVELTWENEHEAGLAIQVWLRWQNPQRIQENITNIPERLAIDENVAVKLGQTSLAGFPSTTTGPRSVLWLALSVERNHH